MSEKDKLLIALIFGCGMSTYTALKALHKLKKLSKHYETLAEASQYLAHVIQENDVELTEFDVIALQTITGHKLKFEKHR